MALIWKHPFTACISGPSGCGKSTFVFRFLKHASQIMSPAPTRVVYCYGEWQPSFGELLNVEFHEGLPDKGKLKSGQLLIIDDLMNEVDQRVVDIFTKHSHHIGVSVMFLTQNFFYKSMRTITLNAHYLVLFKSPRDVSQMQHLAKQMYPVKSRFFVDAFKDATMQPYGYLIVDLKPDTPEEYRLRTGVFPDDVNYVYIPR